IFNKKIKQILANVKASYPNVIPDLANMGFCFSKYTQLPVMAQKEDLFCLHAFLASKWEKNLKECFKAHEHSSDEFQKCLAKMYSFCFQSKYYIIQPWRTVLIFFKGNRLV
ncbi:hypothetical protein HZS_8095, partial [Henneguya salminicola]